ncbi:MAG: CRTAC1 family protein, partial [Planctomycetota bacterium]
MPGIALVLLIVASPSSGPRFVNVAAEAGVDAIVYGGGSVKDHLLESVGCGVAWIDYDNDGWQDLYVINGWALDEEPSAIRTKGRNVLYRNLRNGRFHDVTARAGVGDDGWGCGVCAGDYDNDGHIDLYVTNFGPNRLYRNLGDETFQETAAMAGVADPGWGGGAAFFDADADGDLDLYVANYVDCTMDDVLSARRTTTWRNMARVMAGPFGLRGGRDRFYRNRGDGTFSDATEEAGLSDTAERYGLAVLASDLDGDGDVDVYVANDSNPNFLYRNDGDGTFTDIGGWCGAGLDADGAAQAGMGTDASDFDGDGRLDLIVTNFARDRCTLYHNVGDLFFDDVTTRHEIGPATYMSLSWGCAFFDFDLDGDEDLLIVNGHIYPQVDHHAELVETYRQRPLLFENASGRFVNVSTMAGPGLQVPAAARGLAVADYDNDGDPDLVVSVMDGPPLLLPNDTLRAGHWVGLRLLNHHGSPAVGARVELTLDGITQVREVRSGSTYVSQNALDLHFGLGAAAEIGSIEVAWPGGGRTVVRDAAADRLITIT